MALFVRRGLVDGASSPVTLNVFLEVKRSLNLISGFDFSEIIPSRDDPNFFPFVIPHFLTAFTLQVP